MEPEPVQLCSVGQLASPPLAVLHDSYVRGTLQDLLTYCNYVLCRKANWAPHITYPTLNLDMLKAFRHLKLSTQTICSAWPPAPL